MNRRDDDLNQRIDELAEIVQQLRLELREVRNHQREVQEQQEQAAQAPQREAEFQEGVRIVIINNHRNTQGRTAVVTRTYGERVYFTLDGRPTYRLRQNLRRIN